MPAKLTATRCLIAPLLLAAMGLALPASAQRSYVEDQFDKTLRTGGLAAKNYVRQGGSDPAEQQKFEDYFTKYYFPAMTQSSPEALEDLGENRFRLFRDFIYPSSGAKRQFLNRTAAQFAMKVYGANYHPAVRFNGLLILGMLDQDADAPMSQANDWLCRIATRAAEDGRRPRYELAGALVGLERHTRSKLASDRLVETARTLQQILTAESLAGQYGPGVKEELYIQAATAVANLAETAGSAGRGGILAKAIAQRAADEELSLDARADIAAKLKRVPMQAGQFDGAAISKAVRDLAVAVARQEVDYANRFEELTGYGGVRGMPANRDAFSKRLKQTEEGEVTLRLDGLVDLLADTRIAVEAVRPVAPEADQQGLTEISAAIKTAAGVAADKASVSLDVTDAIKQMASQIEAVAAVADAAEAEAEAAAAAEAEAAEAAAAAEGAAAQPAEAAEEPAENAPPASEE